jgi:hypothetical protein
MTWKNWYLLSHDIFENSLKIHAKLKHCELRISIFLFAITLNYKITRYKCLIDDLIYLSDPILQGQLMLQAQTHLVS